MISSQLQERRPRRPIRRLLQFVLAVLIAFEEWGWEPLQAYIARLSRWPAWRKLEAGIMSLPPYAALALFAAPAVLLLPLKIAALWLISQGRTWLGVLVIIVAKTIGTAVVARLLTLTRPRLLELPWFEYLDKRWYDWKTGLLEQLHSSYPWRVARVIKRVLRRLWHRRNIW